MRRAELLQPRSGAALIFALLLLVVLDCVVLGTLHLAILERRTADNAAASLRLRLAAESAVRTALATWPEEADTLSSEAPPLIVARALTIEGYDRFASIERVGAGLYLVRGEAAERGRPGRAAALLLVSPPPFASDTDFGRAALSVRGGVEVFGRIEAAINPECTDNSDLAVRIPALDLLDPAGDRVSGEIAYLPVPDDLTVQIPRAIQRLAADISPALRTATGDLILGENSSGVLIVHGNLAIASGVTFEGLILVTGEIVLADGARVVGAVHAGGAARIDGLISLDACAVATEARRTRLTVPRPAPVRSWLPAF
jgi:hypothetical protein